MLSLKNLSLSELENYIETIGEKRFRAKQIFTWMYGGAGAFDEMKNLPLSLREKLAAETVLCPLEKLAVQTSKKDGTRKYLFGLADGNSIETVYMKYSYGASVCVSSQAGCRMGCRFCASTIGGKKRDLEPGEIIEQILAVQRDTGERVSHIVVMGTGEPFDNYENVSKFLRLATDPQALGLSSRNITVSTCGIVPKIEKFAEDFPQVNLAISLHAHDDQTRSSMMPVNDAYHMDELLAACRAYTEKTGRRITFEYALVKDKNDSPADADALAARLRGMLCHVNLIPLNRVEESGLSGTARKEAQSFCKRLEAKGIPATVRRELGSDIDAACGQLRRNREKQKEAAKRP